MSLHKTFTQHSMASCSYNKTNDVFIVASYDHIAVLDVNNFTVKAEIDTSYAPKLVSYGDNLLVSGCNNVTITTIDPTTNIPVNTVIPISNQQLIDFQDVPQQ